MLKKALLSVAIFSLLVFSCRLAPTPSEQVIYEREEIPSGDLPVPVRAETRQATIQTEGGETVTIGESMVSAPTNEDGLVAYEDQAIGVIVPVKVTDEHGNPLSGINVAYSSYGSEISVLISDPSGRYAPEIVNLTREELLSRAELESIPQVVRDFFGSTPAEASPEMIVPLVAAIVVILIVVTEAVDIYLTANDVREVLLSEEQVVGYSYTEEYICRSPQYYISRAGLTLDLVLRLVPEPTTRGGRILMTWAGNLLGAEVGIFADRVLVDEPILLHRYIYTPDRQEELLYHGLNLSPDMQFDTFEVVEPVEGTDQCAFVPDLDLMRVSEAREALAEAGIPQGYYEIHCQSGPVSCEDQIVTSQNPEAARHTLVGDEPQMIPLQTWGTAERRTLHIYAEPSLAESLELPVVTPTEEGVAEAPGAEEGALRMFQAVPIAAPIVQSYFDEGFYLVDISAWGECTIDGVTFYGVNEQGYACTWTFSVSQPPPEGVFLGTTMQVEVTAQGVDVEEMEGGYLVFHGYVDYLPGSDVMDSDRASQTARSLCPALDTGDRAVRLSLFPPAEGLGWRWDGNAYQKGSVTYDAITGVGGGC